MDRGRGSLTLRLVHNTARELEINKCLNQWTHPIGMYDKMVVIKSITSINVYLI